MAAFQCTCGAVAEWSKALAWKVSIRQNRIEGSNPSRSAIIVCFLCGRYRFNFSVPGPGLRSNWTNSRGSGSRHTHSIERVHFPVGNARVEIAIAFLWQDLEVACFAARILEWWKEIIRAQKRTQVGTMSVPGIESDGYCRRTIVGSVIYTSLAGEIPTHRRNGNLADLGVIKIVRCAMTA